MMTAAKRLTPDNSHWHWLAVDLRVWRLERNLTQAALGDLLGVTKSHVSNWESARENLPLRHAETLDRIWRTHGHFVRLRRLAETSHDPNWFDQYTHIEGEARALYTYSALVVHALLQTPEYARALITGAQMVEDIDLAVERRMTRQAVLARSRPPQLWCLIRQSALEDPVGGPQVMRAQLAHIHELSLRREIVLQVIPRAKAAHAGVDGSFTLLTTAKQEYAWSEAVGGGRLMSDPVKIATFRLRYELIGADALSRDSSRSLLADLMEAMQ